MRSNLLPIMYTNKLADIGGSQESMILLMRRCNFQDWHTHECVSPDQLTHAYTNLHVWILRGTSEHVECGCSLPGYQCTNYGSTWNTSRRVDWSIFNGLFDSWTSPCTCLSDKWRGWSLIAFRISQTVFGPATCIICAIFGRFLRPSSLYIPYASCSMSEALCRV